MAFGRKPNPEPDGLDVEVEVSPLHEWRMRMLQQAGFTEFDAFRLSVSGADWHECARLLRKGATAEQILLILGD